MTAQSIASGEARYSHYNSGHFSDNSDNTTKTICEPQRLACFLKLTQQCWYLNNKLITRGGPLNIDSMEGVVDEPETNTPRRSDRLQSKQISSSERRKELRKRRLAAKLRNGKIKPWSHILCLYIYLESSDATSSSEEEQNYSFSLKRMKRTNDFTKV